MRNFGILLKRELFSVFVSPLAYGAGAMFLFITGIIFVAQFTRTQLADPQKLIDPLGYILPILFAPLLTMRLLASEKREGTLEMLVTAPVRDWEIVLAKFSGVLIFYGGLTMLTILHAGAMVAYHDGPFDWGRLASGYISILLMASLFLSFGVFISALFENPSLAALVGFVSGLTIMMASALTSSPVFLQGGIGQDLAGFLLPHKHYQNMLSGSIDTRDLCYFIFFSLYFLFLATKVLESRKWR